MCLIIIRPLFIVVVLIGTALTAVSMFTPGWRNYEMGNGNLNTGIIISSCGDSNSLQGCIDWWEVSRFNRCLEIF